VYARRPPGRAKYWQVHKTSIYIITTVFIGFILKLSSFWPKKFLKSFFRNGYKTSPMRCLIYRTNIWLLVNSHQTISHQSQLTPFLVNSPYIWNKEGLFWGGLMVFSTYCGTINLSYMLCRGICLIWLYFKTIKAYFNYKL